MAFKKSDFGIEVIQGDGDYTVKRSGFSKRGNSIFIAGMKRFEEKIQNPDKDLVEKVNGVFRQALNKNFANQTNADGSKWRARLLRRSSDKESGLLPRPRHRDGFVGMSNKYHRSYQTNKLLNQTGYMKRMIRLDIETTAKTMRFKIFPIERAKKYAYIHNYGGVSRNRFSGDGLTVQPMRQFAYLSNDDKQKIMDLYGRYILDLIGGNR